MLRLPATEIPLLRWTIVVLVATCVAITALAIAYAQPWHQQRAVIAVVLFGTVAWGLWRLNVVARWAAVVILWLWIFLVVGYYFDPFAAMEDYGITPPPTWQIFLHDVPGLVFCLFALHVLGKYKREFGRSRRDATVTESPLPVSSRNEAD